MGFSFSATAQCDLCGEYLSSSDEECDHDGESIEERMFRRIGTSDDEEKPHLVNIRSSPTWKWYRLKDEIGDDWIAYEYLGTKEHVKSMVGSTMWDDVDDIPNISMSLDAPKEVKEHGE